jgi:tripartite-type tricarboxylate transporter receptor subunit TctC
MNPTKLFASFMAILGLTCAASAQPTPAGRPITIVVGFGSESGDDAGLAGTALGASRERLRPQPTYERTALLIARHLGRFLPGTPTVTTRSMPGAASLAAVRYLESSAPRDGTVLGVVGPALVRLPISPVPSFRTNAASFNWIGARIREIYVCAVRKEIEAERLSDLRGRDIFFGGSEPRSRPYIHAAALNLALGGRMKIVPGYADVEEILNATLRGEVDGMCGVSLSVLRARYESRIASGELRPLAQHGTAKDARFAWLPVISEAVRGDDRRVLDLIDDEGVYTWPLIAPPGVPPQRVAELRAAFMAMGSDPEAIAEASRLQLDLDPVPGEEVEAAVRRLAQATPADLKALRALSGLD